jgi:hypothetical protein
MEIDPSVLEFMAEPAFKAYREAAFKAGFDLTKAAVEGLADQPALVAQINDPNRLRQDAVKHLLSILQSNGSFHPCLIVSTRKAVGVMLFERMPDGRKEQAQLAIAIKAMLAMCPAEAYWLASEAWAATVHPSMDKAIQDLEPRQREDKREGVVLVTATRTATRNSYRLEWLATERGEDGQVTDLAEPGEFGAMFKCPNPVMDNLFDIPPGIGPPCGT